MHNPRGHRKLGRTTPHRMAMLRNLVTSVLKHERVTTTDARAKEVRPLAEKIITYGKRGGLHARRQALKIVRSKAVVGKVFDTFSKRFANRPGGYTRIIKLGRRKGDCAPLSIIELLPEEKAPTGKGKKSKGKASAKGKSAKGKPAAGRASKPASGKKAAKAPEKKSDRPEKKRKTKKD